MCRFDFLLTENKYVIFPFLWIKIYIGIAGHDHHSFNIAEIKIFEGNISPL